jgi:hypothetical protein
MLATFVTGLCYSICFQWVKILAFRCHTIYERKLLLYFLITSDNPVKTKIDG